jgi:drug/metabolite transporter (DMT)-like permease
MHYPQHLLRGAMLVLVAEFCMASMGALVKHLGAELPNELLVFGRNLLGLLFILPLFLRLKLDSLKTAVFHLHLLRSLAGVSAMYCFFYALINLPLAEGMLLKMTAPLFMPLIATWWLMESVSRFSIYALIIGFAGVLIILRPGGEVNWVMLIGVLGGFFAALAKVSLRRLGRSEPTHRVVFYFALIAMLVSVLPLTYRLSVETVQLTVDHLLLMAGMGLFGTLGQFALTRGYAIANAGTIAPFTYFSVIFGVLYGYVFWQEIPGLAFFAGAVLIALAGVLTMKKGKPRLSDSVL